MTVLQEKQALRRSIRALALALPEEERRRSDAAICRALLALPELAAAGTVFSFFPVASEPDIRPVLEALLAEGKTLAFPRCVAPGAMEARRAESLAALAPGRYGIPEPGEDCPLLPFGAVAFAILPCVAADRNGARLGHGGGYYDRFLAGAPRSMTSAVVCRGVLMPEKLPTEAHDLPATLVVTEDGCWRRGAFFPALHNPGNSAKSNNRGTALEGSDKTGG